MVFGRIALAAIGGLLIAGDAAAQFLNRAVWLGVEEEGVRRDFSQGNEYFLDRMSYVHVAPWWDRGLVRFANEVDYRLGSVASREFTIEGNIDHRFELGDGVAFRYHVLQSETRDTRFVRNAVGLEYETSATTAVFAQGTPFGDKSLIDVSLGAWLMRDQDRQLRVMLTLVDAPSEKSTLVEYETAPYGLHVAGAFGGPDSHRVAFELGAQLPMELRRLDSGDRFELERYIGTVSTHLRLGEHDWLVASLESERTDKSLRPQAAMASTLELFDRTFHQASVEYWRDAAEVPWSIGFAHTYHSEHGLRPNDPANDLRTMRREWLLVARARLPLGEKFSLEPQLFAGNVRQAFRDGNVDGRSDGFEGKISWNARWDFSPNATLAILVSTQIDELAFGGGGAQFVARF